MNALWLVVSDGQGKTKLAGIQAERTTDFYDVKGIVDALLAELGVTGYEINQPLNLTSIQA